MSKHFDNWPKKYPKWNDKYPCPAEVTLYRSAVAMLKYNKSFQLPPEPDWDRIWREYQAAQGT